MKKIIIILVLILPNLKSDAQLISWATSIGDTTNSVGYSIGAKNNYFVCNTYFSSPCIINGQSYNHEFFGKFDYSGNLIWADSNIYGNIYIDNQDNIVVVTNGKFISKYDSNGILQWSTMLQNVYTAEPRVRKIVFDNEGNLFFVGTAEFMWVEKNEFYYFDGCINSNGTLRWCKGGGGSNHSYGSDISIDSQKNIFTCGSFKTAFSIDSLTYANNPSDYDEIYLRIDSNGNHYLGADYGFSGYELAYKMINGDDGFIYAAGYEYGNSLPQGYTLMKMDTAFNVIWKKYAQSSYGLPNLCFAQNKIIFAFTINNQFYYDGTLITAIGFAGLSDAVLLNIDTSGALINYQQFGTPDYEEIRTCDVLPNGSIFISGLYGKKYNSTVAGNITLGNYSFTSQGGSDIYCALVNPIALGLSPVTDENMINIFPNPATSQINVYNPESNSNVLTSIVIADITGKIVLEKSFERSQSELKIDCSNIPSGMYFVSMKNTDGRAFNKKLIIEKQ